MGVAGIRIAPPEEQPERIRSVQGSNDLFAIGNFDLVYQPCIGLCGSRNATEQALSWAYRFGAEAARQGVVVVSGYARGVDLAAHRGALEAGGATIAVIPEGIRHFHVRRELRPSLDLSKNFLALSMFEPDAGWAAWRAMRRNKLIVGLSSGIFVIEARETGGTIDAAYEAVRQGRKLWAVSYREQLPGREGNVKLLASEAMPLSKVEDFRAALEEAMDQPPPDVQQLVMTAITDETERRS